MMKKYYILPKNSIVESYKGIFNTSGIEDLEAVSYNRAMDQGFLKELLAIKDPIVLMIPAILDTFNAYSYDGVEYAIKCYFHFISIKNPCFQIILLGSEEKVAFWEHCEYSLFLKCPHVYYIKNNIYPLKEYLNNLYSVAWDMNWNDCIECTKQLNIKQPASYKTHHSITNEWGIYRWSKYLGIENIAIQKDIEDLLYFNYLKAIYPESKIDDPKSFLIAEKGKVLLIDDESGRGWGKFFESFFGYSFNITFKSIGDDFKTLSKKEIISKAKAKILEFNPDVVLLDLRLNDEDFEARNPSELTGSIIFNDIKEINEGIQVVIFSASNKVWNYLPFASDGVVLKESPENSMKENFTQECITNMKDTLTTAIQRGHFFSSLYREIENTVNNLPKDDFGNSLSKQFKLAFYLISKADKIEQFAFAYISLYMVIELINKEKLEQNQNADWVLKSNPNEQIKAWSCDFEKNMIIDFSYKKDKNGNTALTADGKPIEVKIANGNDASEWQKIVGVLKQELGATFSDKDFIDLSRRIQARNWFIHNDPKIQQQYVDVKGEKHYSYPLHRELYSKEGFRNLFKLIKMICSCL